MATEQVQPASRAAFSAVAVVIAQGTGAGLIAMRARRAIGGDRWIRLLLAASAGSSSLMFVVWTFHEIAQYAHSPFPSLADVVFMAAVLFVVPAVLRLPDTPLGRGSRTRFGLDGAIVALALLRAPTHAGPAVLLIGRRGFMRVSKFLATTSDEVRTPMNGLVRYSSTCCPTRSSSRTSARWPCGWRKSSSATRSRGTWSRSKTPVSVSRWKLVSGCSSPSRRRMHRPPGSSAAPSSTATLLSGAPSPPPSGSAPERRLFPVGDGLLRVPLPLSVAVGWPGTERDAPESVLAAADPALYEAKEAGRNRVVAPS